MNRILEIQETYTNEDNGYRIGESDWYEPWTDNLGKLFRELQREYGRCVSKVYQDTPDGTKQCGWYFEKRMEYEDSPRWDKWTGERCKPETYIRGVWVTYRVRFEADEDEAFEAMDTFAASAWAA